MDPMTQYRKTATWRARRIVQTGMTALLMSLAAGACVRPNTSTTTPAEEEAALPVGPIPLSVNNRSTYQVNIYAIRGTIRIRVGQATSLSRTELTIPESLTNDHGGFALQVLQIGGPLQFVSDNVAPQREERVVLTIQARIVNSALSIES